MMGRGFLSYAAICLSIVLAASADPTANDSPRQLRTGPLPSLVDIAVGTEIFSTLAALVVKAGLAEALSGEGPFTVLAPTNDAFGALTEAAPVLVNNLATSDAWNTHLATVLLYHVAAGKVTSDIIVPDSCEATYTMLSGEDIFVEVADDISITDATGGKSMVQDPFDVMASNGVAHTIDRVLLPSWVGTNIIDLGVADGNFEIVISLLRQTGLDVALTGYGDSGNGLTLFAPLDSAFEGIDASALSDDQIREILLYHVVPVVAFSSTLSTGPVPTLQGGDLDVVVSDSGITVNGISVVGPDALANNGIVHVIDQVLIPPTNTLPSLVDIAVGTEIFSTLAALVVKAGLAEALSGEGPFTVLAPTNDAFGALTEAAPVLVNNLATSDAWNTHLATVLLYHVAAGKVTSDIIVPDSCEATYTMLSGEDIFVEVSGDISITDATGGKSMVQDPFDVMASNGVAHTIDRVLLPSWVGTNIIDLGVADGNFEVVISLLRQTGLDVALTGYGDSGNGLTLFAPLDSAFEGIDASALSDDQIREILLYHVVPVVAFSSTLSTGPVPTLQGGDLDVVVSDSGITVNGISVVGPDALANNGIVHVIDQVLIPPTDTDTPTEKCPPLPARKLVRSA